MRPQRLYELAQAAGVSSKDVMAFLQARGSHVKSASSLVEDADAEAVRAKWPNPEGRPQPRPKVAYLPMTPEERAAKRAKELKRKKKLEMSWAELWIPPDVKRAFMNVGGLREEDAYIAGRAIQAGLQPADLRVKLGQRTVAAWLAVDDDDPSKVAARLAEARKNAAIS